VAETEGAFHTRIKELFKEWFTEKVFRDQDYEKGEVGTLGQLFKEVVEEAKHDILELDARLMVFDGEEYVCFVKKEFNATFVRWFGGEKTE
jgi:hypothetical protein